MKENIKSLSYLKIFFWIVALVVIASIIYRFVSLIYDASFKSNSFSVLYISKESKIIFVDDREDTVSYLSIGDVSKIVKGRSPLVASIALGVPINGIIVDSDKNKNPNFLEFISLKNEMRLLLGFKINYRNMNEYDLFKVFAVAREAEKNNIRSIKVNLLNEEDVKENLENAFLDSEIKDSKFTVEVVNSTNINGLAGNMATVLGRSGYNVVFVKTVNGSYKDTSYLGYEMESNRFVDSLYSLTRLDRKREKISPTADVTIYLGSDLESQFSD